MNRTQKIDYNYKLQVAVNDYIDKKQVYKDSKTLIALCNHIQVHNVKNEEQEIATVEVLNNPIIKQLIDNFIKWTFEAGANFSTNFQDFEPLTKDYLDAFLQCDDPTEQIDADGNLVGWSYMNEYYGFTIWFNSEDSLLSNKENIIWYADIILDGESVKCYTINEFVDAYSKKIKEVMTMKDAN